ncbi:hypothetical protein, partial [Desulfosporosinus metallidurans]|uniref:hypothetical protein n=1 Tax=Desulfosporosinus metallidurans TaxID=1888891 RepID=UPI0011150B64
MKNCCKACARPWPTPRARHNPRTTGAPRRIGGRARDPQKAQDDAKALCPGDRLFPWTPCVIGEQKRRTPEGPARAYLLVIS